MIFKNYILTFVYFLQHDMSDYIYIYPENCLQVNFYFSLKGHILVKELNDIYLPLLSLCPH